MPAPKSNILLSLSLIFAVALWGGNNVGTKFIVASWPAVWTGASRFLCAGLFMLAILRWTRWLGPGTALSPSLRRQLWWQGGLSLAAYIVFFNSAVRYTLSSHVALYLGAAPVWALLWEGRPAKTFLSLKRYGGAALALIGLLVLFWPALKSGSGTWLGEILGLGASLLWTLYGRQCRSLSAALSGAQISAHTMSRAGILLLPFALVEIYRGGLVWRADVIGVQLYCILAGGVAAFAIWSNALRYWPTSQVLLFNNLIPLSTMIWARLCLGEAITPAFWLAMVLVLSGVILVQVNWGKLMGWRAVPPE